MALVCKRCGADCGAPPGGGHGKGLYTYRDPDPAIPAGAWYSVCAECLLAMGGPDYRGMSPGSILASIERERRRAQEP